MLELWAIDYSLNSDAVNLYVKPAHNRRFQIIALLEIILVWFSVTRPFVEDGGAEKPHGGQTIEPPPKVWTTDQ